MKAEPLRFRVKRRDNLSMIQMS